MNNWIIVLITLFFVVHYFFFTENMVQVSVSFERNHRWFYIETSSKMFYISQCLFIVFFIYGRLCVYEVVACGCIEVLFSFM